MKYFIRSTVLGGEVVSDVKADGSKGRTYVRAAGAEIAWQNKSGVNEEVVFQNWDPAGMSYASANAGGSPFSNLGGEGARPSLIRWAGTSAARTHTCSKCPVIHASAAGSSPGKTL